MRASDLAGLPPALIIIAERDSLPTKVKHTESVCGGPVCRSPISRYHGMIHGFFGMFWAIDRGRAAVREASAALASGFALQHA